MEGKGREGGNMLKSYFVPHQPLEILLLVTQKKAAYASSLDQCKQADDYIIIHLICSSHMGLQDIHLISSSHMGLQDIVCAGVIEAGEIKFAQCE